MGFTPCPIGGAAAVTGNWELFPVGRIDPVPVPTSPVPFGESSPPLTPGVIVLVTTAVAVAVTTGVAAALVLLLLMTDIMMISVVPGAWVPVVVGAWEMLIGGP